MENQVGRAGVRLLSTDWLWRFPTTKSISIRRRTTSPCTELPRRRWAPSTPPGETLRSSGGFLNYISSVETRSQVNPSRAGWETSFRISSRPQTTSSPWSYSDPRKLWWRKEFDRKPSVTGSSIPAPASGEITCKVGKYEEFLILLQRDSKTQTLDPCSFVKTRSCREANVDW